MKQIVIIWIHNKIKFKKLYRILVSTPDDDLMKVETCSETPLNIHTLVSILLCLYL
jgi:hypothetical protein